MHPELRRSLCLFFLVLMSTMTAMAFAQEVRQLPTDLQVEKHDILLNSYRLQSAIRSDQSLATLVTAYSSIGGQTLAFGFGAKSEEATFFLLGSLYAEATAYVHSGDLESAEKRLAAIEKACIDLQVPNSLYAYVSKVRNLLATQRYSTEVIGDFLALLQPLLEDYAASKGAAQRTLLRAGAWLVDISLAAAAHDTVLLKQANLLPYFTDALKQQQAPTGVLEALAQIHTIVLQFTTGQIFNSF